MLFDAMRNVGQVDAVVGAAALVVDAKDEAAKRFYVKYGFLELSGQALKLFLPIASVKAGAAMAQARA